MVDRAQFDQNNRNALITVSNDGLRTPVELWADPTTHQLLVNASITLSGTSNVDIAQIGGATFGLGQQLAAASLPIVLTSAQLSTLTPPAAITGFATETTLASLNGKVTAVNTGAVVLAAGTATIGKLAANSGVDIGDVDVTSLTPGTASDNLGKAEDTPHASGDVGVMVLAVRNDTGAVSAGADGDYIPLATDASGALRVDLNGTVSTANSTAVVLAGNAAFTGTGEESLNYNEIRVTVTASHVSATDGLSIQQSTNNINWDITDTYTIPAATSKTYSVPRQARYFRVVYTNGATLQTSFRLQTILNRLGTMSSSQRPGDAYTNETDLEQEQSFLMGYNGTTWDRLRSDTTNGLDVDVTRLPALVAGAATVGSIASITTSVVPGTAATNLGKAEDAATASGDTGIGILGVRNDTLASQTSASGDYGFPSLDTAGIVMTAGAPRLLKARQVTTLTASTAETTIVTAIASTFNDIYGLVLSNTSATATEVTVRDATAGGTISSFMVPAGDTRGFILPVDSAIPQGTVNNNWTATCGTSVSSLKVTALYVKRV